MRYIEITLSIIQIFWPYVLVIAVSICMVAKLISDEIDYKEFRRKSEKTTYK